MKRILFVDDETSVLEGLRRSLYKQRSDWEMRFVESGKAAIAALEADSFDVIVADMRMPEMDGSELLRIVQDRWPATARLVLSGHSELKAEMRAVAVTHQFLAKPCDPEVLRQVVERVCTTQCLLNDRELRSTVGHIDSLPAAPKLYAELTRLLADPDASLKDAAAIVARDPAMSVKVLQVVNSAFFGLGRAISNVEHAASYLGLDMLTNLVLSVEVFRPFETLPSSLGISVDAEQQHALATASLAQRILQEPEHKDDAFAAGLLHDMGKLVLALHVPEQWERVAAIVRERSLSFDSAERALGGSDHGQVGAYITGLWGLPYPIVEAVAMHHRPQEVDGDAGLVDTVYVASALVSELAAGELGLGADGLDEEYLDSKGLLETLPEWRELAHEHTEPSQE